MKNKKKKSIIYPLKSVEKHFVGKDKEKRLRTPCRILTPPASFCDKRYSREYIEEYYSKDLKPLKKSTNLFKLCIGSSLLCASLVTPLILLTSFSAINTHFVKKDVERQIFEQSNEYREMYKKDYHALENSLENGEISGVEYLDKIAYLGSEEYVKALMDSANLEISTKNSSEVRKSNQTTKTLGISAVGAMGASIALALATKPISNACDKEEEKLKKRGLDFKSVDFI